MKILLNTCLYLAVAALCCHNFVFAETEERDAARAYNNARFRKAISLYKNLSGDEGIDKILNMAIILKDAQDYDKAIRAIEQNIAKENLDKRAALLLARLYYLSNKPSAAINILEALEELFPQDVDTQIILGLSFEDKGDDESARVHFEKAISLDKDNILAHISLADIYTRKSKLTEALKQYKEAYSIDSSIIALQEAIADLFYKMGDLEEALKVYQKLNLIAPETPMVKERLDIVKDKLGSEYFEKQKEKVALSRKLKEVTVEPFPEIKGMEFVKVGLSANSKSIGFKCSSPFEIRLKDNKTVLYEGEKSVNCLISIHEDNCAYLLTRGKDEMLLTDEFVITPLDRSAAITLFNVKLGKENYWLTEKDRSYRGDIEMGNHEGALNVINRLSLEEYLYGVVPSEMPSYWHKEALKAQAVAARSEALRKLGRHKREGFDFCPEVHCQVYSGIEQEASPSNQAVDETRGIIMVYKDRPVDAIYSSTCGGHTQDNIFGRQEEIHYLRGRPDTLTETGFEFPLSPSGLEKWIKEPPKEILCRLSDHGRSSNFRWVRIYSAGELNSMVSNIPGWHYGKVRRIITRKRQDSGHLVSIRLVGETGSLFLERELVIRKALGNLRSSMFKVEIKYGPAGSPESFIFYGGGWGHAVGMCQYGAYGMALQGKNFKEILEHYFHGVELKKLY